MTEMSEHKPKIQKRTPLARHFAEFLRDCMNRFQLVMAQSYSKLCFRSTFSYDLELTFVLESLFRFYLLFTFIRCRTMIKHGMCAFVSKSDDDGQVYQRKILINICFALNILQAPLLKLVLCTRFTASHVLCHHIVACAIKEPLSDSRLGRSTLPACLQCLY